MYLVAGMLIECDLTMTLCRSIRILVFARLRLRRSRSPRRLRIRVSSSC